MRVNVYSQELTEEVNLIEKLADTDVTYSAVQFMLHSSERLHDRSAVTFWLPKSQEKREMLARAFRTASALVLNAKPETGLD